MRVLITGASGMVGQNLANHEGLKSFELLTPERAELDLFNFEAIKKYLAAKKPDLIVHCAGKVGGIQANIREPVAFLVQNIDINRNLILAARESGIKKFLNLGSSCMYPRDHMDALKEEQVLKGELEPTNEGYAIAKIMAQRLCEYISREDSSFQYKTLIPCNLYGRYDHFDPAQSHLIPAVIKKLHDAKIKNEKTVEIWGDGTARREFMYSEDLADCVWECLRRFEEVPALMNVGLGHDYSINDYYSVAAKVMGYQGTFKHDLSKPTGMKRKLVDVSLVTKFGWKSRYSLEEGLKRSYEYFLTIKEK